MKLFRAFKNYGIFLLWIGVMNFSCASQNLDFSTVSFVDKDKYMGDWYVQGHTPLWVDEDSSDQRETYTRDGDQGIKTQYSFRKKGEWKHLNPYGRVYNQQTNAHWKMQFLWPFTSDFLIVELAPDYSTTVVSVPGKDKIWIMSRQRQLPDTEYSRIVESLRKKNYPVTSIRRVPQSLDLIPRGD